MNLILPRLAGILLAALAVVVGINVVWDREYSSTLLVAIFGELSWHFLRHGSPGRSLTVRSARKIRYLVVADARARMKREPLPDGSLIKRFSNILAVPGGLASMLIAFGDLLSSRPRVSTPGLQPTPRFLRGDETAQLLVASVLGVLIGRYVGALLGRALEQRKNPAATRTEKGAPPTMWPQGGGCHD